MFVPPIELTSTTTVEFVLDCNACHCLHSIPEFEWVVSGVNETLIRSQSPFDLVS